MGIFINNRCLNFVQWSKSNTYGDYTLPLIYNICYITTIGAGWSSSSAAEQASADFQNQGSSLIGYNLEKVHIITYLNNSGSAGVYSHLICLGI